MRKIYPILFAVFAYSASLAQNVGVDVAVPKQKLDVAGAIKIAGAGTTPSGVGGDVKYESGSLWYHNGSSWVSMVANTDDQEVDQFTLSGTQLQLQIENDVNGLQSVDLDPLRRVLIDGSANDNDTWVRVTADNGSDNDKIRLATSSLERLVVASDGKIGLGVSAPTNPLHLEVSATGFNIPFFIRNKLGNAGNGVGIGFITETNNSNAVSKAALYHERTTNFGVGPLHFLLNNDNTSNAAVSLTDSKLTILPGGNVGIGVTNPTYKLQVAGKLKTNGVNETSDARLKKNVEPISSALEKVLSMNGLTYDWKSEEFPELSFESGRQYGLLAQELEKIIPELVETDDNGWKSIEYSHIVPILIEAIKEQQSLIEKQTADNSILQNKLEKLSAEVSSINLLIETLKGDMSANAHIK